MIFVWIVIGLFNLPVWALQHARPPFDCRPFYSNYQYDITIGYCENVDQVTIVNGRYTGYASFTEAGTVIIYRKEP